MRYLTKLTQASVALMGAGLLLRVLRRPKPFDFVGKSVVIVGGSRGLGLVMARQLADQGARLTLLARDRDELMRARQELSARGADVLTLPCDIRDEEAVPEAMARVVGQFGRIDVLINDAGVIQVGPVEHMTLDDFDDAMETHLWGPFYTMQAAIPYMRSQGGGRIVNISSIGGKVAIPHLAPYSASKFALVGLSDAFRAELAKDNILITTVCPGLMRTGSPPNAFVKGQHRLEYALFTILDALPLTSTSAEHAASQILAACQRGDAQLIITIQAKLLVLAQVLFPELTASVMALVGRWLPGPNGAEGAERKTGWESQSALAPSILTRLSDQATARNNEWDDDHAPLISPN
jgi:NAD(P)-dependent dehydrogenase (short-subunit alcohol dehydrogenase family)